MTYGLTPRMVIASGLLAVVIGAAFAVLVVAMSDVRDSGRRARHSLVELVTANQLEKLLIDLETGQRGFVITRSERFLQPWNAALIRFPEQARSLVDLADDPRQRRLAAQIADAGNAYIREYSVPLVRAARRNDPAARTVATTDEGKRRVDALRAQCGRYERTERDLADVDQDRSDAQARRAVLAGTAGLAGSVILIALFGAYLLRAMVLPVRRAAAMACRLAAGDLAVRMPETGTGEIGELERSTNDSRCHRPRKLGDRSCRDGERVLPLVVGARLDDACGQVARLLPQGCGVLADQTRRSRERVTDLASCRSFDRGDGVQSDRVSE